MLGGAAKGADLVRAAVPEFARALGTAVRGPIQVVVPEGPVPILVLHATALLAVLEARDRPPVGSVRVVASEQVLAGLLDRERTFWLGSARTAGLAGPGGLDSVTAAQAVAVACLITVVDESGAAQALRRVPGLTDAPSGQLRKIARWLRQLYPTERADTAVGGTRWWGYLQPDLLAERHVVYQLADAADFANACLQGLTPEQARGALTVLARACAHRAQAPALIAAALREELTTLGVPAIAVAIQTGGRLGGILADVFAHANASLATLIQFEEAIPYPSVALAEAAAVLAERINLTLPEDAELAEIARWRHRLGLLFAQAGRPDQALAVTQEAITAYRELAATSPDRYRPYLAESLDNLTARFSTLGRGAEAEAACAEAQAIHRVS